MIRSYQDYEHMTGNNQLEQNLNRHDITPLQVPKQSTNKLKPESRRVFSQEEGMGSDVVVSLGCGAVTKTMESLCEEIPL